MAPLPLLWRHLLLGGAAAGLGLSVASPAPPPGWLPIAILSLGALIPLRAAALRSTPAASAWALLCAALGVLVGLGIGEARLAALEREAFGGSPGQRVLAEGHVAGAPRFSIGELRFPIETSEGRLLVSAPEHPDLGIGDRVRVRGSLVEAEPFRADELERAGASLELRADRITTLAGGRSGLPGALDRARGRAERALTAGLSADRAALARGFVLGQDDRIKPTVREDFRRSGLAHLLSSHVVARTRSQLRTSPTPGHRGLARSICTHVASSRPPSC